MKLCNAACTIVQQLVVIYQVDWSSSDASLCVYLLNTTKVCKLSRVDGILSSDIMLHVCRTD